MRSSVVLPAPLRPASVMRSPRSSLNGHAAEQGSPRHVLVQRRCDHNRHAANRHARNPQVTPPPAPWACGHYFRQYRGNEGPHSWDAGDRRAGRAAAWGGLARAAARARASSRHAIEGRVRGEAAATASTAACTRSATGPSRRDSHFIAAVLRLRPGRAVESPRGRGAARAARSRAARSRSPRRAAASRSRASPSTARATIARPTTALVVDGIPTTSVARTLVDLADVAERTAADQGGPSRRSCCACSIWRAIERALDAGTGPARAGIARRVLAGYQPEPHVLRSEAERRVKRAVRASTTFPSRSSTSG